eukprot:scaffold15049_cov36-Cyclotella_meneghiniana.AAC.6
MDGLHIGTPPFHFMEFKTIYVHNYIELSKTRSDDNFVTSPRFRCFGNNEWELVVYPGGSEQYVKPFVQLRHCSDEEIRVNFCIMLFEGNYGDHFEIIGTKDGIFCDTFRAAHHRVELPDISNEGDDYLDGGTLFLRVGLREIREADDDLVMPQCQPAYDNMAVFLDDDTSDIVFDLNGTQVVAHKSIIKAHAKEFYVMCEASSMESAMLIEDVTPEIFKLMLRSLYGGIILPTEWKSNAKTILTAASKYGFNKLKYDAEVWYAKSLQFTLENVIDVFLEADGCNWVILRDAAKKYMCEHAEEVLKSESFDRLRESKSLLIEIMTGALQRNKKQRTE